MGSTLSVKVLAASRVGASPVKTRKKDKCRACCSGCLIEGGTPCWHSPAVLDKASDKPAAWR